MLQIKIAKTSKMHRAQTALHASCTINKAFKTNYSKAFKTNYCPKLERVDGVVGVVGVDGVVGLVEVVGVDEVVGVVGVAGMVELVELVGLVRRQKLNVTPSENKNNNFGTTRPALLVEITQRQEQNAA